MTDDDDALKITRTRRPMGRLARVRFLLRMAAGRYRLTGVFAGGDVNMSRLAEGLYSIGVRDIEIWQDARPDHDRTEVYTRRYTWWVQAIGEWIAVGVLLAVFSWLGRHL